MKRLLFISSFVALLAAAYLATLGRSSYSAYSPTDLALIASEARGQLARNGEEARDADFALALIEREQNRRVELPIALLLTVLLGAAAIFTRGGTWVRQDPDEAVRFATFIGNPEVIEKGARAKAAALLEVAPEASRSVVEAAFQAKLAERDPSRLEGLAPDLRRIAEEQLQALHRARELLLRKSQPG